jgi:hypothetical protein
LAFEKIHPKQQSQRCQTTVQQYSVPQNEPSFAHLADVAPFQQLAPNADFRQIRLAIGARSFVRPGNGGATIDAS